MPGQKLQKVQLTTKNREYQAHSDRDVDFLKFLPRHPASGAATTRLARQVTIALVQDNTLPDVAEDTDPDVETDHHELDGPRPKDRYFLFGEMLLFAIISLIASFILSRDAILLAADPTRTLSCSLNEVFDCVTVGNSWQARVLGFPNAFLGLIAEPVVMTIAVASLSRVRFPRWFMFTANAVYLLGVIFAYWLLYQSTFVIGALCPWCVVVTVSTTFVFYSMTVWNILEGNLFLSESAQAKALKLVRGGWITIILVAWLAVVLVVEAVKWLPQVL